MTLTTDETLHVYRPSGAAAKLFRCYAPEVLMDGPAGTGKTRAILTRGAQLCDEYAKTRILIARDTRTACTESILVTMERDVLPPDFPGLADVTRAGRQSYNFPNGSCIVVGGLDHPEKLYSTEWDVVYIAEATETTEDAWEKFARAMRNKAIPKGISGGPQRPGEERATEPHPVTGEAVPAFWTQRIADCNPAAPGHWLNQRASAGKMVRLLSRHVDNPSLTAGYLSELSKLSGHRRARLFEGRWTSAEGSVYPEFSDDRNVCAPFPSGWPADWPVYVAYDSGYDHPCAVIFYGVAPDSQPFIFDEIHGSGITLDDLGPRIREKLRGRRIVRMLADPRSVFSKTAQGNGVTIAEYMRKTFDLSFSPWPAASGKEVENQVEAVRSLIRDPVKPLLVWRDCKGTIGEFQSWSFKRTADGSLPAGDDQYEDRNNDAMDAIRGLVAMRPSFEQKPVASLANNAAAGTRSFSSPLASGGAPSLRALGRDPHNLNPRGPT